MSLIECTKWLDKIKLKLRIVYSDNKNAYLNPDSTTTKK